MGGTVTDASPKPLQGQPQVVYTLDSSRVKVEDLWFDDGTIVLVTPSHMFRVYLGLLAIYSMIFRDMLSLPRPKDPADEELYNGVPVVHLSDHWEDIRHFLKFVFEEGYAYRNWREKGEEWQHQYAIALLKISTKYQAMEIRKTVIDELTRWYPYLDPDLRQNEGRDNDVSPSKLVVAIAAFREAATDVLLPMAFYRLARNSVQTILFVLKDSADLLRCLEGREKLQLFRMRILSQLSREPQAANLRCEGDSPCWREINRASDWKIALGTMPFVSFTEDLDRGVGKQERLLCDACSSRVPQTLSSIEFDLSSQLPGIFDLGSWESLKDRSDLEGLS